MAIILGVDVGGSTTKIVAFDKEIIGTLQVRANDQMTSRLARLEICCISTG